MDHLPTDPAGRTRWFLERCEALGFARAGVAAARPSAHTAAYEAWIAAGKHGEMRYLEQEGPQRQDPGAIVPGARSVLCVADRYADGRRDARVAGHGRIARYARGEDYHQVLRARLEALAGELRRAHPAERFRVCVDTAPLLEREHAARAGLGRIGKHTLLIAPDGLGSWTSLGAIVSTLEFAPTPALEPADPCAGCTRCIEACPTQAIAPFSVDGARCVSYLTIEHEGPVDPALGAQVGDWVFGCDACQEACPHAQPTRRSRRAGVHEAYAPHRSAFPLLELLGWNQQRWEAARLNGVLARVGPAGWRRNAALACIGALADPGLDAGLREALLARLHALAASMDEPPAVRQAAQQAIDSTRAAR
ncbi:MAG: tRNA epoxyqueuosine(34) reductase QueG [Phycisphaerales bacterium]